MKAQLHAGRPASKTKAKTSTGKPAKAAAGRDWSRDLVTRTGLVVHVRPVRPDDEAALADLFQHVTPQDLHFRFLGGLREVSHERLVAMTHVDHRQTENFLAFAGGGKTAIGTAMLACDATMEKGEVAISIRAEYKHKGVAWELLRFVAQYAEAKGLKALESIESRENHEAIELEKEQGFVAHTFHEDAALVLIRKEFGQR
jgi:GNAT superfamily N-acetyltransferase